MKDFSPQESLQRQAQIEEGREVHGALKAVVVEGRVVVAEVRSERRQLEASRLLQELEDYQKRNDERQQQLDALQVTVQLVGIHLEVSPEEPYRNFR